MEMPTYQSAVESNYSGEAPSHLQQDVQRLAPLATTFVSKVPNTYGVGTPIKPPSRGVLSSAGHFLGGVLGDIGGIGEKVGAWLGHNALDLAEGVPNFFKATYDFSSGLLDTVSQNNEANRLIAQRQNLTKQWQSGLISSKEFTSGLQDIIKQQNSLSKQLASTNQRLSSARAESVSSLKTIATITTAVLTDGLGAVGGEGAAARLLTSTNANAFLDTAEKAITKVATDENLFSKLTPAAQKALQEATATAVSSAKFSSGAQIARSAVSHLLLKYPIIFNYISGTSSQVYKDLQAKKYGAAVNVLALNAAIAVGGGILGGPALSLLGRGTKAAVGSVFARSSFMDELSKGLFNDEAALYNAAKGNQSRIKALSDLEATHMTATNGDPVAAAWRVINGERSVDGLNAVDKGADGWLDHNITWAKNAKLANETAEKNGLGAVSVGRWTANNARMVSEALSESGTPGGRLEVWESLKQQYPNSAFANNPNLDAQIKHFINTVHDSSELADKVNHIKAGRFLEGFPEAEARLMAKDGFLPISGAKHAASFIEGSGELASKFASGDEFFTKAVSPLPVLGSVGAFFTKLGLSPYASTQQVNLLYNTNLATNLSKTSVAEKVAKFLNDKGITQEVKVTSSTFSADELKNLQKQGYTPEMLARLEKGDVSEGAIPTAQVTSTVAPTKNEQDAADYIRKIISSYANKPTRRLLNGAKILDERQMTQKDLITAFDNKGINITRREATELQTAISRSQMDINMAIKGLGDKAVDFLYSTPGVRSVERRFLRLQGSLRFSYNPFFQYLRAVPKLEILSESEGGGFVKSIFMGRLKQMKEVREGLRTAGFLDKTGSLGNVVTDEAAVNATGRNLVKKLLPQQEDSIAGLVDSLSQKAGTTWQDYISQNPEKVRDLIQSIAEYDRKSDFLNSPLARSLNIAFFPFRFDAKVLKIMTKGLARQDYLTKVAVIQGVAKAHEFLNSPQGQAWYQQNADAIGLFKYITPLASFNEIFHSLLPGNDHSLGNFGELGGLPFGWIPQILDAEGLTQFNQPGANPKTGAIYPQYIPVTMRGQVAIAIQDLIGAMFSYPGATAGLPSKTQITRNVALGIVGGSKTKDLKLVTPQAQMINALLHGTPQPTLATQESPSRQTSATTPKPRAISSGGSRKKKADFTPELLPGQTQLGQL